jgi:hypothetical protein
MDAADTKASAARNDPGGGWGELLKVIAPALITGLVTYVVARIQSEASVEVAKAQARSAQEATEKTEKKLQISDQRIDESEEKTKKLEKTIKDLVIKLNDFKRLREVSGRFREPKPNDPVGESISCEGSFEKLPQDFHLWVAVEIDGFIYFKEKEASFPKPEDGKDTWSGTWSTTITEPASSKDQKVFNLRLYAATEEGHYQIQNWIEGRRYEKIPWMSNTIVVNHVDGLRLPTKSKR